MHLQKVSGEDGHILVKSMEMEDPTFESETLHTATATFANPKTVAFDFTAELYLGKTVGSKVVTSGSKAFSLLAGASKAVDFAVTMPKLTIVTDTFHCYLEVKHALVTLITFVATEDVIVVVSPAINVTQITWV